MYGLRRAPSWSQRVYMSSPTTPGISFQRRTWGSCGIITPTMLVSKSREHAQCLVTCGFLSVAEARKLVCRCVVMLRLFVKLLKGALISSPVYLFLPTVLSVLCCLGASRTVSILHCLRYQVQNCSFGNQKGIYIYDKRISFQLSFRYGPPWVIAVAKRCFVWMHFCVMLPQVAHSFKL